MPWAEGPGGPQSMGLQRVGHNQVTEHTHIHTHINIYNIETDRKRKNDLLWGIGLRNYGGWEIPQSAICKLETQESRWYTFPVRVPRPENRNSYDISQPKRRRLTSQLKQSGRQSQSKLPPPLCSIQALSRWDDACPRWGRLSALPNRPIQILISPGNTFTDAPRNNV